MVRNLVAYRDKHKLDTVRGVISRWAPGEENDTEAYIASVSARLRVKPDDKLGLRAWSPMMDLVKAIIWHENGEYPYDDAMVEATVKGAMSE